MTAVSEGKSRDVPSRRFPRGRRGRRGKRVRGMKRLSPLILRFLRRPVPDFRTRRNERRTCGTVGTRDGCPRWKKKSRALLPAHERTKETIVEYEVEYKLSSRDRARNQSTSCLASTPSTFSLFSRLSSSLFQTLPDVTRRSDEVIVQRYEKTSSNLDSQ